MRSSKVIEWEDDDVGVDVGGARGVGAVVVAGIGWTSGDGVAVDSGGDGKLAGMAAAGGMIKGVFVRIGAAATATGATDVVAGRTFIGVGVDSGAAESVVEGAGGGIVESAAGSTVGGAAGNTTETAAGTEAEIEAEVAVAGTTTGA